MNEHDVGLRGDQRFKSCTHRGLARRAAFDRRRVMQAAYGVVEDRCIIRIHHRLHGDDLGMAAKRFHRAENHRLPAD